MFEFREKRSGCQDRNVTEGMQAKQVVVAAYQVRCTTTHRQFQGLVVLWIAAHVRGYVEAPMQRTLLLTMLIMHGLAVVVQLALSSGQSRQRTCR